MTEPLRILAIGAHPDDCDITVGGTAALWAEAGHTVRFVSVTNGESGHHERFGDAMIVERRAEAAAAGAVLGIDYTVLDFRDGRLEPSYEARCVLIRLIREFNPNLILTHRPNDYHPDHRYTSQLVCDAAYMVTVPNVAPEATPLRDNPAIAYVADRFQRPYPFSPTVG
ncbi:MAG: PIG-L deacetylase family protein [Planctomycetota bacterium]|jgi:LmbE family N-acetylglucosaminyl deacetylase